jgi:hypothetical protein
MTPASTFAAGPLSLAGGQAGHRTVALSRKSDGTLSGGLKLLVSGGDPSAKLRVSYYPTAEAARPLAGSVSFASGVQPAVPKGRPTTVALTFSLPKQAAPGDLEGLVKLESTAPHGGSGGAIELDVKGAGAALDGVLVRPATLMIHATNWAGPFHTPSNARARIQLSGPGVPELFGSEESPPAFDLLLRADSGQELHAKLSEVVQSKSDPEIATATVAVDGNLHTGKYVGTTPISDLAPGSPQLTVTVESGHSFLWPLLVALLGALSGGALYLGSNRSRRKTLLRNQAKSLVGRYVTKLDQLKPADGGAPPIWTLEEYLGSKQDWYKIKWNAVPEIDGAFRSIWSNIHWARNEDDLTAASQELAQMRARILRWLTVANSLGVLAETSRLEPKSMASVPWSGSRAIADTRYLLRVVQEIEPPTDSATIALTDRITRQAHWHHVLARAWNAKTVLDLAITADEGERDYDSNAREVLPKVDLVGLDGEASPESGRNAEKQVGFEEKLAGWVDQMRATYRGPQQDLEMPDLTASAPDTPPHDTVAVYATGAIYGEIDRALVAPAERGATARPRSPRPGLDRLRGASASDETGDRIPPSVALVLRRDLPWTIAVGVVSAAAYVPTVYSATWGSFGDYVSAFAAGFVGKVVVNSGALPLFQSIRPTASSATASAATADASTGS